MRLSISLALLLSTFVTALRNPHERARNAVPKRPAVQPEHLQRRGDPLPKRQSSRFLNNATQSMYNVVSE